MIQRIVVIKLKDAYANEADRAELACHTRDVLSRIEGVRHLDVATPGDERCERSWDLCILVRFDDVEAVEAYRLDAAHRAYVDVFLKPMLEVIRVWNFDLVQD